MEDEKILELYEKRDETAIDETKKKYGAYCRSIAFGILRNREDAEECEHDAYLGAWHSIPPERPCSLAVYLGSITRRIALDRYRRQTAAKRGGGELALSLSELDECIADGWSMDEALAEKQLSASISAFLNTLRATECDVFLRRYWYFDTVEEICVRYGFGKSKVKSMLMRTRQKLRIYLEKEGFLV
ncbi:MAG: sigma-70 family RNA polymerase sigma factor [Clostridia bacterium]|nr:sigma-70 family RNA polymerase sigma factor [Clostridia bacterium]